MANTIREQADAQALNAARIHGSARAAYAAYRAAVGPFPPYLSATPLEREYPWALDRLIKAESATIRSEAA